MRLTHVFSLILLFAAFAHAQTPEATTFGLFNLPRLKTFSAYRTSSENRYVGSNDDSAHIMPGETFVMANLTGPGMVTHIWVTVADNEFGWPRLLRLRVYYDGNKTPSVDAPLGDFFGVGQGLERNLNSMMVQDSSFGRARNSYWPMPFRKSCKITVTNEGNRYVMMYYYHVDYRKYASLPSDIGYFHAYYRQENPARHGHYYQFLDIKGSGQYVGAVLNVIQTQVGWFGEGDDLFYIDGAKRPQITGTGTEDYFNEAWGLRVTEGPWTGTPVAEGRGVGMRFSAYRWHVPDPIPFRTSLLAEIEHAGWTYNPDGSVRSGFEERPDFFSSVAFWYQKGVNQGLTEPPYGEERLPLGNADQIAIEKSINDVTTSGGKASVQLGVDWGKNLLFFDGEGKGSRMDVPFDVPSEGRYEVLAEVAQAPDYGNYAVLMDGKLINSRTQVWPASNLPPAGTEIMHNYAEEVYVAKDWFFGWHHLTKGRHTLAFICVGKNDRSSGYNIGINDVVLEKIPPVNKESENAPIEEVTGPIEAEGIVYRGKPLSYYVSKLKNTPERDRPELVRAIGDFGAEGASATDVLVNALSDPDENVRVAAAWSLTQIGPSAATAVPTLAKALSDSNFLVRDLSAQALEATGPKAAPAVPELIRALNDPVGYVRCPAARALGAIGPAAHAAVKPLADRLLVKNENGFVLGSVASALGDMGPGAKSALPVIEQAIKMHRLGSSGQEAVLKIEGKSVPTWW
jgi:D-arabinan exo alpha-(1,3)/(1,5)-arabinofuranosidase (non-reducing end)